MKKSFLTALIFLLAIPFMMFPAAAKDGLLEEHSLQIQYLDENGSQVFPAYSAQLMEGEEYSVPSPASEEAVPNPETVSGVMGDGDIEEVVTYATKYNVIVKCYYYDMHLEDPRRLFHTYIAATAPFGSSFSFYPKRFEGLKCNCHGALTGTIEEAADRVEFISYNRLSYQLTVKYQYADGSQAFPDHTETVKYLDPYSVESPPLEGY